MCPIWGVGEGGEGGEKGTVTLTRHTVGAL